MERSTKRRTSPPRRRLALVTRVTAADQSMVEYAVELLPLRAERLDIDLIAGHGQIVAPEALARDFLILNAQEVSARHTALPYDLFVYQWRSAPQHWFMLDLLRQFPGLIALHDFSAEDLDQLVELNLLSPPGAANEWVPGLGLLVYSVEAWQQARQAVNSPVLCLAAPSSAPAPQPTATSGDFPRVAAAYAGWIDLTIDRHEQRDGLWSSFASQCLAACPDQADRLIGPWTRLRTLGQQRLAARRRPADSPRATPSAA